MQIGEKVRPNINWAKMFKFPFNAVPEVNTFAQTTLLPPMYACPCFYQFWQFITKYCIVKVEDPLWRSLRTLLIYPEKKFGNGI